MNSLGGFHQTSHLVCGLALTHPPAYVLCERPKNLSRSLMKASLTLWTFRFGTWINHTKIIQSTNHVSYFKPFIVLLFRNFLGVWVEDEEQEDDCDNQQTKAQANVRKQRMTTTVVLQIVKCMRFYSWIKIDWQNLLEDNR